MLKNVKEFIKKLMDFSDNIFYVSIWLILKILARSINNMNEELG